MRQLIIGFSTPKKFRLASFLIRLFERSVYSHIYIKMMPNSASGLDFPKVFQASHGDVNAQHFDSFREKNHIFYEYKIEITDAKYYEIASWLWLQLGKPYGFLQLIGIALKLKIGSKGFICSELAGMVLKDHLGFDINKSLDYIGLNDIREILEKR